MKDENSSCGIRARIIQMCIAQGKPFENTRFILQAIENAKRDDVELIVFPELSVPGSGLGNLWRNEAFLRDCENCGELIKKTSGDITAVFGNVAVDWTRRDNNGRARKYNALFTVSNGEFIQPVNGTLPFVIKISGEYVEGNENDLCFYDARDLALEQGVTIEHLFSPVITGKLALGCILCGGLKTDRLNLVLNAISRHPTNLILGIGNTVFAAEPTYEREHMLSSCASSLRKPFVYATASGIHDEGKNVRMYEGASCVYDETGRLTARAPLFRPDQISIDIPLSQPSNFKGKIIERESRIAEICEALLYGIDGFTRRLGLSKIVIGLSGGIDSALVAALYSRIFKQDDILLVNMPSKFVSAGGRALARELAQNLKCLYAEIPIDESVALTASQIENTLFSDVGGRNNTRLLLNDFMMENVQARDRSSRLLAAIAAAFGGVFTCNANKAEATIGYSTLYGDLAGYLAPIGDLWKREVYELSHYLNDKIFGREMIPEGCFKRAPSAELNANQNADHGKGDPLFYPYHDRLFEAWTEWVNPASPEEILEWFMNDSLEEKIEFSGNIKEIFPDSRLFVEDLERWWKQYHGLAAAKRIQAPPVLSVKPHQGIVSGEPQSGAWFSHKYQELKKRALT